MTSYIQKLLERQAEWQKSRKSLSWPEKIHMAEAIRESVLQLRRSGRRVAASGSTAGSQGKKSG
jgi:hypothetical protein